MRNMFLIITFQSKKKKKKSLKLLTVNIPVADSNEKKTVLIKN